LSSMNKNSFKMRHFRTEIKEFINNPMKYDSFNKFVIYFPQFHEITENNHNFYKGFSDYENLVLMNKKKYNFSFKGYKSKLHNYSNDIKYVDLEYILRRKNEPDLKLYNTCRYEIT